MSNAELDVVVLAIFALHLGVLIQALFWRREQRPLPALNAGLAVATLLVLTARGPRYLAPADWPVIGFAAFEVAVLVCAAQALTGRRWAMWASRAAFGLHFVVSVLAAIFALTFKMTRLF